MAKAPRYFLLLSGDRVVGPHTVYRLREWTARRVLTLDSQVCKEGEQSCIRIRDIPDFENMPEKQTKYLEQLKCLLGFLHPQDNIDCLTWITRAFGNAFQSLKNVLSFYVVEFEPPSP